MSERRRYSQAQKVEAVAEASVTSSAAASEKFGIPERTIAYWVESPAFAELRAKTRAEFAEGFRVLALQAQARLQALIPTMEARDLTILLGVATDKGELLSGHATERTESRDVTSDLNDHEREALRKAIDDAVAV